MFVQYVPVERTALQILEELPQEFRLTGSRLLAPAQAEINNSDLDFFTLHSPNVVTDLLNAGFFELLREEFGYLDDDCVKVFRKGNVDVQLRKNPYEYQKVCRYLAKHTILTRVVMRHIKEGPVSARKVIWNQLLIAAKAGILES